MKDKRDIILEFSGQVQRILGDSLTKVILYGSFARGDYTDNQIWYMVLTSHSDEEIEKVEVLYQCGFWISNGIFCGYKRCNKERRTI